jgi:hypothetical protein
MTGEVGQGIERSVGKKKKRGVGRMDAYDICEENGMEWAFAGAWKVESGRYVEGKRSAIPMKSRRLGLQLFLQLEMSGNVA